MQQPLLDYKPQTSRSGITGCTTETEKMSFRTSLMSQLMVEVEVLVLVTNLTPAKALLTKRLGGGSKGTRLLTPRPNSNEL